MNVEILDKWFEFTGFDSLVMHFLQFLKTDNVEMRNNEI